MWMKPAFPAALAIMFAAAGSLCGAQAGASQAQVIQWMREGSADIHRGDFAAAESLFQRVVTAAPDLSDGYLGLGLTQLRLGDVSAAIPSLKRAVELNSQLPGAHLFLGIAQYQAGQESDAADSLQAELALNPKNVEALRWRGVVELALGHPGEATKPLDEAAELAPKDPSILYYKARAHILLAEDAYRQLVALDPDSALVHRARGDMMANSGQPEKAIAEYEAAIQKDPHNPDLYELAGEQDQKVNRLDAAVAAYETELKMNSNSAVALYNLGKIDLDRGDTAAGVALLRRAQAAHAVAAPTDYYLGLGLAKLNHNEEAAHWLESALENQPSSFVEQGANYQLARVYQKLHREADAQRALARLKELKAESAKTITRADRKGANP